MWLCRLLTAQRYPAEWSLPFCPARDACTWGRGIFSQGVHRSHRGLAQPCGNSVCKKAFRQGGSWSSFGLTPWLRPPRWMADNGTCRRTAQKMLPSVDKAVTQPQLERPLLETTCPRVYIQGERLPRGLSFRLSSPGAKAAAFLLLYLRSRRAERTEGRECRANPIDFLQVPPPTCSQQRVHETPALSLRRGLAGSAPHCDPGLGAQPGHLPLL